VLDVLGGRLQLSAGVLPSGMSGSMKDALRKAGLAPPAAPPSRPSKQFREELPDDETLPPLFEAPALTVARPLEAPPPRLDDDAEADGTDGDAPNSTAK
jgi:hypothetical protein